MSASLLTNMTAITAVANLTATQKSLAAVQNEISSGLAVGAASDNAAYFAISQTMQTQNSNLAAVTSSLNLGSSVLNTATSSLSSMTGILNQISSDLVLAKQSGTGANNLGTDITALQNQLKSAVQSASFNGVNLLDGSNVSSTAGGTGATTATGSVGFVSAVTGSGSTTAVSYINVNATTSNFGTGTGSGFSVVTGGSTIDVSAFTLSSTSTQADITNYLQAVGGALANLNTAQENLGAAQKNISLQTTFIQSLTNSITTGVGSLIDADMNQASTKLNALQTQQQLGVQSLSIANQNSQLILKLFGG